MGLNERDCPHCGNTLAEDVANCPCGFSFTATETHVPAPASVRSGAKRSREAGSTAAVVQMKPVSGNRQPNAALLMSCQACAARISKRAARCPKCGRSPYEQCQVCASRILASAAPCPECGDPLPFGG